MQEHEDFIMAWMRAVRESQTMDVKAKGLLMVLVSYAANRPYLPEEQLKPPSLEDLTQDTGMSQRLLEQKLREVQREGFITISEDPFCERYVLRMP